ncbi:MAG: hypothetical protein R2734_13060 [Nocardioides sp.]
MGELVAEATVSGPVPWWPRRATWRRARAGKGVRIRTLGGFGVDVGGEPSRWPPGSPRRPGTCSSCWWRAGASPVHRETLLDALAGGAGGQDLEPAVRGTVHAARRALEPEGRSGEAGAVVSDRSAGVRLDLSRSRG